MDYFDFLGSKDEEASTGDLDSAEGEGSAEDGNGGLAQELTPVSIDVSGLLELVEDDAKDGDPFLETDALPNSSNPRVDQMEPGVLRWAGDPIGERDDRNFTAEESPAGSEDASAFFRSQTPIGTGAGELPNSPEDTENKLGTSTCSGSSSSLESDGYTPWAQAVLVTKDTKEAGTCASERTEVPLRNSDWVSAESPSTSEPLTPSCGEETDEELLKDKSADLAQLSDTAVSPDEVIMDPSDVAFLQNDVWHQNQLFVPIPAAPVPATEHEGSGGEEDPEVVAEPMDCHPPNGERGDHGNGEAATEILCEPSTQGAASTLPSYIASVHKELVVWDNEATETEQNPGFPFGYLQSSSELKLSNSEESTSSFYSALAQEATIQVAANTTSPGATLASGSQDPLVREILRDRVGGTCRDLDVSVEIQEPSQMWDSEYIGPLSCGSQDTDRIPMTTSTDTWRGDVTTHLAGEQDSTGCIPANRILADHSRDDDDNTIGQELGESSQEEEEEGDEGITAMPAENDAVQMGAQPETAPETGVAVGMPDLKVLLANGNKPSRDVVKVLASRLYNLDGFKRTDVAPYLVKNNEFSQMLAEEYLQLFDFSEMELDQALRNFLKAFVLTGETQERERVLYHFSNRFQQCNPNILQSRDAVHTIICALMLLNTDLHGQNLGKSMSSQDFITNLEGMNDGKDFPKDMLKALYQAIKSKKMEWAVDEEEVQKSIMGDESVNMTRITDKGRPFLEMPQDNKVPTYKQGFLSRKVHADIDGKKTPWGKRSWKTFYAVLKGTVIYLLKDEYRPNKQSSEEAISIHHALATKAAEYNKRPHVFRLKTADWRIFLFQAQSADQMNSWIMRINLVAAMFSSPPFPAAVGSKRKFSRPILPSSTSKQSQEEQLESHDAMLQTILDDLDDLQMNFPEKKGKAKEFEEFKLKQEYFEYERCRIETYVNLLKIKLNEGTEDLDKLEAQMYGIMEEGGSTLKKSHSSPSLNLEQPPVVKVKRNVSERRTYRKIIPSRHRKLI
ncbi:uncharacterized protein LOC144510035 [Mustelus asterias]